MIALPGVLIAFALMFLSDCLKMFGRHKTANASFFSGLLLLLVSSVFALFSGERFLVAWPLRVILLVLAAFMAVLEIVSLFVALPAKETYLSQKPVVLVDTGMYALCRHPGALWLTTLYLMLSLGLGSTGLLWTGLLASMLNILYVLFQDTVVFPRMIPDYAEYKKRTPFVIPSRESIKNAFAAKRL